MPPLVQLSVASGLSESLVTKKHLHLQLFLELQISATEMSSLNLENQPKEKRILIAQGLK